MICHLHWFALHWTNDLSLTLICPALKKLSITYSYIDFPWTEQSTNPKRHLWIMIPVVGKRNEWQMVALNTKKCKVPQEQINTIVASCGCFIYHCLLPWYQTELELCWSTTLLHHWHCELSKHMLAVSLTLCQGTHEVTLSLSVSLYVVSYLSHMHTHTHVCKYACAHTHTQCMQTRMHVHAHIHQKNIHTHTHTVPSLVVSSILRQNLEVHLMPSEKVISTLCCSPFYRSIH